MKDTVLIDTNILLDSADIIFKLSKEYQKILIPLVVLKELDKHKYNKDLSYSARAAIKSILDFKREFPDRLLFHVNGQDIEGNDALILHSGEVNDAVIATKDVSMSIMAEARGLETKLYDVVLNNVFNPYVYLTMESLYEREPVFSFQQNYRDDDYKIIFEIICEASGRELSPLSWFFIFIQTEKERPYVYANNPIDQTLTRIDNYPKYLELDVDGKKIKTRDMYQNCLLFALIEAPHVLITGRWGSGKTLLSTAYTLSHVSKKAFITRPPVGVNAKYDLGFFPGDKKEKMIDWLGGFTSALYYIYGNTKGQILKGVGYDYVKDTLFHEKFEVLPINSIQGLSLLDNDVMMVDEVQLTSIDILSMVLSRPSESGKLILMGDLKQSYNIVKPSESGLLKLLRILPHKSMAYVELQNSYRSELLEVADKLQDKVFV
jgi:PhoH-like ATPase